MNTLQEEKVTKMRLMGDSYSAIAASLDLSVNTVKSFCQRHKLGNFPKPAADKQTCLYCGGAVYSVEHRKPKKFCSDKCRMSWWNAHPELLRHKTVIECRCRQCGSKFNSYGKRERKFCSLGCYRKYRSELAGGGDDK